MKTYLIGSFILFLIWLVLYILRKDLRKNMLLGSIVLTPTALAEVFFVPSYWSPDVLIEAIKPWDIESFLFCFALGGIAAVIYEFVTAKNIIKYCICKKKCTCLNIYIIALLSFILTNILFDINAIYDSIIAAIVTWIAIIKRKPNFIINSLAKGLAFLILYFLFFELILFIDPLFVNQWTLENLSGILILGIPLEEYAFAFLFGAVWTPIYEIAKCHNYI